MADAMNGAPIPEESSSETTRDMKLKRVPHGSSSSGVGAAWRAGESGPLFELPKSLTGWMPYLFTLGVGGFLYSLHLRSTPRTGLGVVVRAARDFRRLWRG